MRNLNELSITAWLTVGMLLIFVPGSMYQKPETESSSFYYMRDFDLTDWLISIGFGITGVFSQTTRAKASHYEEPAKLTVLNYFQTVIQLAMDVLFLNTSFTS